jgi:hypothetical protein
MEFVTRCGAGVVELGASEVDIDTEDFFFLFFLPSPLPRNMTLNLE